MIRHPYSLPVIILLLLGFVTLELYAGSSADRSKANPIQLAVTVPAVTATVPEAAATTITPSPNPPSPMQPAQQAPSRAEQVMKAIAQGYPDRVGQAEYRNGDWAVPLGGRWYYYAEGRLLPEELRSRVAEYTAQTFYNYVAELPPWTQPTEQDNARMRQTMRGIEEWERQPIQRSNHFFDALWRMSSRDEAWDRVKTIRFLGHTVMMHYSILEELSLVEEKILVEARTNSTVLQWINSLGIVEGWNWRNISASQSRSFHSYGAAIDLLPQNLRGLATYWQWTAEIIPEWWTVPYSMRYHPPLEVIKIFESFGFAWGGKWMVYDTMHFEYRPDILILNGIPQVDRRSLF